MTNTGFKKLLMIVICLQFLSSCFESKKSSPKAIQNGTNQINDLTKSSGTGDSGGGNAINLKMLESYIIDPTELAATKDLVLPALLNTYKDEETMKFVVKSDKRQEDPIIEAKIDSINLFKMKTWYLAPIALKQLPKEALGVEFTENNLQQIAIQTENEIWIDANLFNQMNKEEQARLIMHEMIMSLYLINFYSVDQICALFKKINYNKSKNSENEACENPKIKKQLAELVHPQPKRKLNGNDYNSIREATSYILNNYNILNDGLWKRKLRSLNFDSLYTYQGKTKSNSFKSITKEEMISYFKMSELTNRVLTNCHFTLIKEPIPCKIQFEVINKSKDSDSEKLKINLISNDGKINHNYEFNIWPQISVNQEVELNISRITLYSPSIEIGKINLNLEIVLKNNEMTEISIIQNKLVQISKEIKKEGNKDIDCLNYFYKSFIPKNIFEDNIFVTTGHHQSESLNIQYMDQFLNYTSSSCPLPVN